MQVILRVVYTARLAASLNADPKFKKYTSQVERCLQTFDNVHEWADFIAFLTKLLKVRHLLFAHRKISNRMMIETRLSNRICNSKKFHAN